MFLKKNVEKTVRHTKTNGGVNLMGTVKKYWQNDKYKIQYLCFETRAGVIAFNPHCGKRAQYIVCVDGRGIITMTRSQMITAVAAKTELSEATVEQVMDGVFGKGATIPLRIRPEGAVKVF